MKLGIFSDNGIGRFFAQLFDNINEATFFISEKNKSGLNITPKEKYILSDKKQTSLTFKSPLKSFCRFKENNYNRKIDFHYLEIENAFLEGRFDTALVAADRSLYTLASLKKKGYKFKLIYWCPFTIPFVDMFDKKSLLIRQFSFQYIDHFIAITNTCKKVLELEGTPSHKITAIYPGIDLKSFYPRKKETGNKKFNILFVGKLVSWKGCYTLLYAAKKLINDIPELQITFVGKGAQRAGLEEASLLLGIREKIVFTGFIPYEKMPDFYSEADVFVLPALPAINFAEQFGFVVAEAMACGLPTIVSDVGGLPEVVGNHPDLLFVPGNYNQLADRLLAIHNNKALRDDLSNYVLDIARNNYDASINGALIKKLVDTII